MADDPLERAKQLRMRAIFEKAGKEGYFVQSRHARIENTEERVRRIQTAMAKHHEKWRPHWLQRETNKLIAENRGKLKPKLTPKYLISTETTPAALAQRAWNNVNERIAKKEQRLKHIENKLRQQNKLTNEFNKNTKNRINT